MQIEALRKQFTRSVAMHLKIIRQITLQRGGDQRVKVLRVAVF